MTPDVEKSTLRSDEVLLWLLWKQVSERIRAAVITDVAQASDSPEPELTALVHINTAGGTLRQNALATVMGWDRTRLSHLLTRMESRGCISRTRLKNGVEITIEKGGREVIALTAAPFEAAVQRHLIDRLSAEQRTALIDILQTLQ